MTTMASVTFLAQEILGTEDLTIKQVAERCRRKPRLRGRPVPPKAKALSHLRPGIVGVEPSC